MNLSHIIEALPLQVYIRRGELVIHFSSPADLITRLAETSAVLSDLERVPVEPDALFALRFEDRPKERQLAYFSYEADRGTMVLTLTDMLRKFRGYHHFIKKQQRHKEAFGIHPVRAVLVE